MSEDESAPSDPGSPDLGGLPFGEVPTMSAEYFRYWVLDHSKGEVSIHLQDGRTASTSLAPTTQVTEIAQTVFDWEKWWVISCTKRGDTIISEAYSPLHPPPFGGRPSVYLDQNHWSSVAMAVVDPGRVRPSERAAALRLYELARDGGIVCPLSSATLAETGRLDRDRRYQVGLTVASMAGGWQLRHPLEIRRNEFAAMLLGLLGGDRPAEVDLPVVSLEPYSLMDDEIHAYAMDPNDQALFLLALSGPSVTIELLLDPERVDSFIPDFWVATNEQIATALESVPPPERRPRAHIAAWLDNLDSIREALALLGRSLTDIEFLLAKDIQRLLQPMPMVGLFTEMMVRRHLEPKRRWRGNDLTDMMFLTAGAAYCDYVAAERSTGRQLMQVQRSLGRPENVFTSLEALAERLHEDGVRTATERAAEV